PTAGPPGLAPPGPCPSGTAARGESRRRLRVEPDDGTSRISPASFRRVGATHRSPEIPWAWWVSPALLQEHELIGQEQDLGQLFPGCQRRVSGGIGALTTEGPLPTLEPRPARVGLAAEELESQGELIRLGQSAEGATIEPAHGLDRVGRV